MSLVGLWFAYSGIAELIVSGMETLRILSGGPSLATFDRWRARVDAGLTYWTATLIGVAVVTVALQRWQRWSTARVAAAPVLETCDDAAENAAEHASEDART